MTCYIVEYSDEYAPDDIYRLLENVPDIDVEEFLFANSKLNLRYVVLEGDDGAIESLEDRDEFLSVERESTGAVWV